MCQITSLKKSPCFLSSASIALSRIPPDVALDKGEKKNPIIVHQIYSLVMTDKLLDISCVHYLISGTLKYRLNTRRSNKCMQCNLLLKHVDFGLRKTHDNVANYVTKSFK